jgi:hypothetical protein
MTTEHKEPKPKTGYELAILLHERHTHAELCKPEARVYREQDVIGLLHELGYPTPDFEQLARIVKFWNGKPPR